MNTSMFRNAGIAIVLAALLTFIGWQQRELRHLRMELAQLQAASAAAAETTATTAAAAAAPETSSLEGTKEELLRLRAEVSKFRLQQADWAKERSDLVRRTRDATTHGVAPIAATTPEADADADVDAEREKMKAIGIAKLNFTRHLDLAFKLYAKDHGNVMPESLAAAAAYFQAPTGGEELSMEQFELTYHGSLDGIAKPAETIILREKDPFPNLRRPGFSRTYLFADGHSEIHTRPDNNFEEFEKARTLPAP
jgi:hypothetical protein